LPPLFILGEQLVLVVLYWEVNVLKIFLQGLFVVHLHHLRQRLRFVLEFVPILQPNEEGIAVLHVVGDLEQEL